MTKEHLYELAKGSLEFPDDKEVIPTQYLDKFFRENVCIPKGVNRHPDAEVLHRIAEDVTLEHEISGTDVPFGKLSIPIEMFYKASVSNDKWFSCWMVASSRFRIKPSEPIYEYIWYNTDGDTKWMTLDEAEEFERTWFWAKETSRMRQ